MMKRTGVPRLGPDDGQMQQQNTQQLQQPGASNMHTLAQSAQPQILGTSAMISVGGGGFGRSGGRPAAPAVINYLKPGAVQYAPAKPQQVPPRIKVTLVPTSSDVTGMRGETDIQVVRGREAGAGGVPARMSVTPHKPVTTKEPGLAPLPPLSRQSPSPCPLPTPPQQFQRLKVEDALSYLDQVKFKFNNQPQVYNDFLDIMKEFKSQTIDTPGVITRVSNLFKGHPELIVGFNTFLPPGYKIEVQSNGQVSVSMPSPTGLGGAGGVLLGVHHSPQPQLVHLLPVPQSVSSAIVHNLSVSGAGGGGVGSVGAAVATTPANTLHQISQAHQQIEAAAIHHAPGGGGNPSSHTAPAAGQPVEFNHAIEYVNKIKSRFSRQPDKYKRFLEILHAYQRGHRDLKEPQAKQQTEQEVYSQVAKLFENQEDLLTEFGQFLPDAKAVTKPPETESHYAVATPQQVGRSGEPSPERERFPATSPLHAPPPPHHQHHHHAQVPKHSTVVASPAPPVPNQHHHLKRSPSFSSTNQIPAGAPPAKKARGWISRDVSLAEAAKLATPHDLSFFDRARRALRHHHVYDNFLRCLLLFTNEIISSSELLSVTAPFLCRHPELQKWLQDFVGPPSPPHTPTHNQNTGYNSYCDNVFSRSRSRERERERERERFPSHSATRYESIGQPRHDRNTETTPAMDIDLTTCKRLGTSYCALPREAAARRCSGRTPLCKEVLNDTWVSFPTWSEDSTFVTSRKTQYEEYIYRCEDERFELDVVIETNASTIRVLEGVQKKLSRMSAEEAARYRLDECLGGSSPTIHQRALRRIYGDKVAVDIIAGLKKNPVVAVPVVLRRLKAKEEEWREAQKGFNKQWREQNEKYYLKSLDHQGINFKQNDLKAMRSKSLFNEVESAYAARRPGPHLVVDYNMQSRQEAIKIVRDTAELLIHHARRQTGIQKAEKQRIKQLLRHFLPDLFNHPRQPLSDDERDDEEKEDLPSPGSPASPESEKPSTGVKQEIKQESSESDNASDKSGKTSKNNKENKPKNNNTDSKEAANTPANTVKRSSSNEDPVYKSDNNIKGEPNEPDDDFRDYPPNEARFVCTSSWYLFLRVHGALCQRLAAARRAALLQARDTPGPATALRLKPNNLPPSASSPSQYYSALLELVRGVLDGNVEASAYEDAAREMLGIRAYPAYTLDKLVSSAVRQLQHCVSEPWSVRAAELASRGGMRGSLAYVRRARRYLRQAHTAFLVRVYGGDECKVTFELLEGVNGEGRTSPNHNDTSSRLSPTNQSRASATNGPTNAHLASWSAYAERLAGAAPSAPPEPGAPRAKPVFLARNARARCGGPAHNACSASLGVTPAAIRRRKPPRVLDTEECTLAHNYRARRIPARPLQLYQPGALATARRTNPAQHAKRQRKFRAWLLSRHTPRP